MTMVLENLPANVLCSSAHNIVGEPRILKLVSSSYGWVEC